MSYITIHSDNEDGTVNNILQQDIIFPKQSKVALVNLNVELIESVLKLDENVTINISLSSGDVTSFVVEPKNYTNLTYYDVQRDLTTLANRALIANKRNLGSQFHFFADEDDGFMNMAIDISPYYFDDDDWEYDTDNINVSPNDTLSSLIDRNMDNDMDNLFQSRINFSRGTGTFRTRIKQMSIGTSTPTVNENRGFILALVKKDLVALNNPITLSDLTFAINLPNQTKNYRYQLNNQWVETDTTPVSVVDQAPNNDVVELLLSNGKIFYNVHQANGVKKELYVRSLIDAGITRTKEQILKPIIILGNDIDDVELEYVRCSFDSMTHNFNDTSDVPIVANRYGTVSTLIIPDKVQFRQEQTLEFEIIDNSSVYTKSLGRFLGFPYNKITSYVDLAGVTHTNKIIHSSSRINYDKQVTIRAHFQFRPTFFSKMFFIEFTSQELESYNTITGGKKNILLPIALHNNFEHHIISYEPKNLYFVNLNNVDDVLVRNYQFRILNENMEQVVTNGRTTLTIVVNEK